MKSNFIQKQKTFLQILFKLPAQSIITFNPTTIHTSSKIQHPILSYHNQKRKEKEKKNLSTKLLTQFIIIHQRFNNLNKHEINVSIFVLILKLILNILEEKEKTRGKRTWVRRDFRIDFVSLTIEIFNRLNRINDESPLHEPGIGNRILSGICRPNVPTRSNFPWRKNYVSQVWKRIVSTDFFYGHGPW